MIMRATLEFTLPEETIACQEAFHARESWTTVREIAVEARRALKHDAEPVACLRQIQALTDEVLALLGA
jgi:hypothetical protein